MSIIGPERVSHRVVRSLAYYESTDLDVHRTEAKSLMLAASRRWPLDGLNFDLERVTVDLTIAGWGALSGDPGPVSAWVIGPETVDEPNLIRRRRLDVSRHFEDTRFDGCGFLFTYETPSVGGLNSLLVVGVAPDGSVALLPPTDNVVDLLGRYGLEHWNSGPLPQHLAVNDQVIGHVDDLRIVAEYRAPWRARRRIGLIHASFSDTSETIVALSLLAVDCGLDELARAILAVGQRAGTLPRLDQATILVALGEDDAARIVLATLPRAERTISMLADVDRLDDTNFTQVLDPSQVVAALPAIWHARPPGSCQTLLDVPALGVFHVSDATLVRGTTVLVGDRLQLYEPASAPSLGFVAGTWDHIVGMASREDVCLIDSTFTQEIAIDEGILISGRCDFNHFHFLIEYLPRVGLVDRLPALDGIPFIVTDELNQSSRDALGALSDNRPIITVSRSELVRVRSMHIPSMHTYVPDSTRVSWLEGCRHSPTLLLEMRDRLLEAFPPVGRYGQSVFLARSSSSRGLENADELLDVAVAHGLECVDPGKLTLREQIDLFHNATFLLGVGGAAFANAIFARRGTRALSMVSAQLHDFSMHSTMAELAGVDMTLLLGTTHGSAYDFPHRRDYLHAGFSVDAGLVDEALSALLSP